MNNTPQPNVELINKVIEQIDAHPETWRQDYWAQKTECGAAYCFAGWACVLAGDTIVWRSRDISCWAEGPNAIECIHDRARYHLGIGVIESEMLFSGDNTREDIQEQVNQILARAEAT
jgi:hypothetical protein